MDKALVTILIANYKTSKLTKLCLRLIRKFTDPGRIKVIVIDNDSQDESLAYLKALKWITLLERTPCADETPSLSHSRALDLALPQVTTPYMLLFHTDTFVKTRDWLDVLLSYIEQDDMIAGVGSWKLESKSWFRRLLKYVEQRLQLCYYQLINKTDHKVRGGRGKPLFLRSHLALYRTDLFRKLNLKFEDQGRCLGEHIQQTFVNAGYKIKFIDSKDLLQHVEHFNHATMVLNPELGARDKTIKKGLKRIQQGLKRINADAVLEDDTLDG